MTDNQLVSDTRKCQQIWQRVRPDLEPYGQGGDKLTSGEVMAFMVDELGDRCYYLALSRCVKNKTFSRALAAMGADEAEHYRRLRGAYFIMTGQWATPDTTGLPKITSVADSLRARYLAETRSAEAYKQAAARASDPELEGMLSELAEAELCHGSTLWNMLAAIAATHSCG